MKEMPLNATKMKATIRSAYYPPEINHIVLDNEISLVLESDPPDHETCAPEYFKNDPFKANLG